MFISPCKVADLATNNKQRPAMTRSSPARVGRRLGRPPKDDQLTIEFALALKAARGMSERAAFDLAVAWFEARMTEPTKQPRGSGKHPGLLIGYDHPAATIAGRAASLRQKSKSKRHPPRPDVVRGLTLALRCRDVDGAQQLFDQLLMLAAMAGPDRLRRVMGKLSS
jgi:hypothetical protein